MFALFFDLYLALFRGVWTPYQLTDIKIFLIDSFNGIGEFFTSIFNNVDTPMMDLGRYLIDFNSIYSDVPTYLALFSFVLAVITSIGIVVMAVKGVKRAFGIFFMGIRR